MVYRWDFEGKKGCQWLENFPIAKLCSSAYFLVNNGAKKTDLKGAWILLEKTVMMYRDHNGAVVYKSMGGVFYVREYTGKYNFLFAEL